MTLNDMKKQLAPLVAETDTEFVLSALAEICHDTAWGWGDSPYAKKYREARDTIQRAAEFCKRRRI